MDYEIHTFRAHADGRWYARASLRVRSEQSEFETDGQPTEESAEALARAWVANKLAAAGVRPLAVA